MHGTGATPTPIAEDDPARWVERRIAARDPAAVIRFGDGEARLLTLDPADEHAMRGAVSMIEREAGLSPSPASVLELKRLMSSAFEQADLLGIAGAERFPDEHRVWMRKLDSLHRELLTGGRPPAPLADCLLSHAILERLPEMLQGRRASAISCRDLVPVLERDWGAVDVRLYQVPSQYRMRVVDGEFEAALHRTPIWPDAHACVRASLTVRERGEVFLVGAGLFGKDLCIRVRELGGIAIDMGSALDRVAGKVTRGPRRRALNLHAAGMPADKIASNLQRLYGTSVEEDEVSRGLSELLTEIDSWRRARLRASYASLHLARLQAQIAGTAGDRTRDAHLALATTTDGTRLPLGIWWRGANDDGILRTVVADLRRRGIRDPQIERIDAVSAEKCAAIRAALDAHGPFADEEAATKLIALALAQETAGRRKTAGSDQVGDSG